MNRSYASALVKLIVGIYPPPKQPDRAGLCPVRLAWLPPFSPNPTRVVMARARAGRTRVGDSAAPPEHEQVLARVNDLTVRPIVRLEEVDPVAVQLLTALTE
jgi:hypothetical protein